MWAFGLFVFLFVVSCFLIFAEMFDKFSRGDTRGTLIMPMIPLWPVLCWLLAMVMDWRTARVGSWLVICVHVPLILVALVSIVCSIVRIRKGTPHKDADANKDPPPK